MVLLHSKVLVMKTVYTSSGIMADFYRFFSGIHKRLRVENIACREMGSDVALNDILVLNIADDAGVILVVSVLCF